MGILLSIDLGTEGARVGAFTEDGVSLGSVHRPYRTTFPRPGWAEQDPETWWTAFVDAARTLLATDACRSAGSVVAFASATTASTVAILNEVGTPLRPALLWMDTRASPQAVRTAQHAETHTILAWSGGSDAAEWLLPKAIWLKENEPAVYGSSARIVEAIDYLTFRLTGRWVGSQMNAVCKYN
jgi:sugar (pentulose or hexulose) kinase